MPQTDPHEFKWRTRQERESDPDQQNLCRECNGWATEPQHGGQYCDEARQIVENDLKVTVAYCGWCSWRGPSRRGWTNQSVGLAGSDARRHLTKAHADTPPQTAPYAGRLPGWPAQ